MKNRDTIDLRLRLKRAKEIEVENVDPSKIEDIKDIVIDPSLPVHERVMSLLEQCGNPYIFRNNGIVVKISFSENGKSLQQCAKEYLEAELMKNRL